MRETVKGVFGMAATNGPVLFTQAISSPKHQHLIEMLQVLSLSVGILVGILTAFSITLTIYWKLTNKKGT